jgi:hypothetical protein
MSISSKLSPESNLVPYAKKAEDSIAVLRAKGLASEANQFEQILQRKISDKDPSIMDTFGQLDQIYGANLKTSKPAGEKEKVEELPDFPVIADRIQDALRLGEDSNIRVSPVLIQNAFEAEIGGDAEGAFNAAKSIEKEIEEQRKQQVEEDKPLETLGDGTQVRIGKKTGTRYSVSGIPLSSGPINTSIYNKVVEQFTGVPQELAQPTSAIDTSPQVYEQPVQQAEPQLAASQEEKIKAQRASLDKSKAVLVELDRFINATEKMSTLPFASPARKLMAAAGFEQQAEVENMLITIRANLQFEQIKELKALSPTGSTGLGAVTKPEFDALGATLGQLSQVGDPKVQKQRALALKKKFLDAVHGSKEEREEALKQGKITKEANEMVESLYPGYDQSKVVIDPRVEELRSKFGLPPR